MADFKVEIVEIEDVRDHPDADRLDIGNVRDYIVITAKGLRQSGDLVAYIPEGALVPDEMIEEMGLTGRLAGSKMNRVKAMRLRGIMSQGLIYPITGNAFRGHDVKLGDDVTELLGITKWIPPIPTEMTGEVFSIHEENCGYMPKFDVENLKNYPDVLEEGEPVELTEKIHGTCFVVGVMSDLNHREAFGRDFNGVIASKGLSEQSFSFKNITDNEGNLYVMAEKEHDIINKILDGGAFDDALNDNKDIFLLGEIYGSGVQDLHYGLSNGHKGLAIFDIKVGDEYLTPEARAQVLKDLDIPQVPVLYSGEYNRELVDTLRDGREEVSNTESNLREGVVIRPLTNRRDDLSGLGRVILKHISDKYLLRKNATEYN